MNSKAFEKELGSLNSKYNSIISDIVSAFPRQPATDGSFQANIVELQKIQEDFFIMKRTVDKNNETFTQGTKKINDLISSLMRENAEMIKKINNLESSDNAADGVLSDNTALYSRRLLFNNGLLFTTVAVSIGYYFLRVRINK